MLRLKPRQREVMVEKLPDLANVIAGALIFGQFIAGQPFSPALTTTGIVLWSALALATLRVAGEDQ